MILISKDKGELPYFPPFFNYLHPTKTLKYPLHNTEKKGMKYALSLYILLIGNSLLAASNQSNDQAGSQQLVANDKVTQILKKYTEEDSEVVQAKKTCQTQYQDEDVVDCIWSHDLLSKAKKKEIYDALNFGKKETTYAPTISNFKRNGSAAVKKLEHYLEKRLSEALADTTTKNNVGAVQDHTVFLRLYKTQLGKNLISEIASYCIYSDPNTGYVPETNPGALQYYRKLNISNLNKKAIIDNKSGEEGSAAFNGFTSCMSRVGKKCRGHDSDPGMNADESNSNPKKRRFVPSDNNSSSTPLDMISSCELNRLMTGVKDAITKTDGILETFKNMKQSASLQIQNPNTKTIDVNKIVNIGSKELVEKSGYAAELKNMAKELKTKCTTPTAATNPECKKYFSDKQENKKLAIEYDFRNKALAQKLKHDLTAANGDMNKLKKIYKDQGMSDADFKQLLQNVPTGEDPFNYLKNMITDQYTKERSALKDSLNAKLEQTQLDKTDPSSTEQVAKNLANRYENSADSLATLYQYANIVSSFIQVDQNGQKMRNTASLSAELNSNYFSADSISGRNVAGADSNAPVPTTRSFDALKGFDNGSQTDGQHVDETSLSVEDINNIQWLDGKAKATPAPTH